MLLVSHLTKSYAGVRALADASLDVRAGEIHALVGENGAGEDADQRGLARAVFSDEGVDLARAHVERGVGERADARI